MKWSQISVLEKIKKNVRIFILDNLFVADFVRFIANYILHMIYIIRILIIGMKSGESHERI